MSSLIGFEVVSSESLEAGSKQELHENIIYDELKNKFNDKIFKNYELLNFLYENNPAQYHMINESIYFNQKHWDLLSSKNQLKVSINSQFEEKQSDTADIIYFDNPVIILDVNLNQLKKRATSKHNIFYKLAECCKIMLESEDFDSFEFLHRVEFKKTSISDTISNMSCWFI